MHARLAWTLTAVTVLLVMVDIAVSASYRPLLSEDSVAVHGFPFVSGAVAGSAVMGALVISRYARHPIGWLLCLVGVVSAVSLLAESYSIWVLDEGGPGPAAPAHVAGWLSTMLGGQLSIAALAVMFLLAPDGHFLSPRWRRAAEVTVAGSVVSLVALLMVPPLDYHIVDEARQRSPLSETLFSIGFLLITAGMVASLVSLILRLRRSHGDQRRQLRLIATAAGLLVGGIVALIVVQILNGGRQTWASSVPLFAAYFCLPLLFAVAVLRYRLYDIEVIVNRAVVLAVATLFAGIGYTGLVVAAAAVIGTKTDGFVVSLLATAAVALAFQPVRGRVVALANRLAYGPRAAPYEALSDFSRLLADTPSSTDLLPAVAEAAARSVSARSATAELDVPGGRAVSVTWPAQDDGRSEPGWETEVRNGPDVLGRLVVRTPRGVHLQVADQQLLRDLAEHAALAFRNAATEARLAQHVVELDRTTAELMESRQRIVDADDAARRTLEGAIAREVLPALAPMPGELARLHVTEDAAAAASALDDLVERTNRALEELRDLTRGVFPMQLARAGLAAALGSLLTRRKSSAVLDVDLPNGAHRFEDRVEAAVYFCCVEATRSPDLSRLALSREVGQLVLRVSGVHPDDLDLQAVLDRVDAVGGTAAAMDPDGLVVAVPVADPIGVREPAVVEAGAP